MAPMADMNVVPLVDVMLVLLVIFIVTAPLLTHAVKIDLPKASSSANVTKPEHIEFGIREERVTCSGTARRWRWPNWAALRRRGATAAAAGTAPPRRPQCALRKRGAGDERSRPRPGCCGSASSPNPALFARSTSDTAKPACFRCRASASTGPVASPVCRPFMAWPTTGCASRSMAWT
jgi:hypothetical protein